MNPKLFEIAIVSTKSRAKIEQLGTELHRKATGKVNINELLQFLKKLDESLAYIQDDVAKCSRFLL